MATDGERENPTKLKIACLHACCHIVELYNSISSRLAAYATSLLLLSALITGRIHHQKFLNGCQSIAIELHVVGGGGGEGGLKNKGMWEGKGGWGWGWKWMSVVDTLIPRTFQLELKW